MACLFVLHLGVVLLRKHDFGDTVRKVLEVFGGIWLMVPLLVGGQGVAEERKLGTWAAHLSLPISSRVQFAIKVFFVLIVGGLLSPLLLVTAETIATATGAGSDVGMFKMPPDGPLFALLFVSFPVLALIGFYASTLTRSLVQALAVAVLTIIGIGALGSIFSNPIPVFGVPVWRDSLIYYVAWPIFALTFLSLTYRNFKRASESSRLWRRNALALVAVLAGVAVLTTALYHRVWELLTPLEPAHGTARLTIAKPPRLKSYGGSALTVIFPDGRLWVDRIAYDPGRLFLAFGEETGIRLGGKWTSLSRRPIVAGSNWVDVVANFRETVGIRSDGTLWVSEKLAREWDGGRPLPSAEEAPRLVRFGDQTNWQSVVREDYSMSSVLLLKKDGMLWRWGTNSLAAYKLNGLRALETKRLGNESDWEKILSSVFNAYAWKSDGTAWVSNARVRTDRLVNGRKIWSFTPVTSLTRVKSFDQIKWRSLVGSWPWQFGVREDGTLWAWDSEFQAAARGDEGLTTKLVQIGRDNNWSAVATDFGTLAGLKVNGTIWAWSLGNQGGDPFRRDYVPASESPIRLGTHNDCVAVAGAMGGIVSLAADGSLWYWYGRDREDYRNSHQPLLAASRRPSKIGNIFGKQ